MRLLTRKQTKTLKLVEQNFDLPELSKAVEDAVARGDWTAAKSVLANDASPFERQRSILALADAVATEDAWIKGWLRAEPNNTDANIVWACSGPSRAWRVRGGGRASETTQLAFRGFAEVLQEAEEAVFKALQIVPNEPSLWIAALHIGRGSGVPKDEYAARWNGLVRCDPFSFSGHNATLQYWCNKWYGSHDEMYAFAREATLQSPQGSRLALLTLNAHAEYLLDIRGSAESEDDSRFLGSKVYNNDIDFAMEKWAQSPPIDSATERQDRSIFAWALCEAQRWKEAAAQFVALDSTVQRWGYLNDAYRQRLYEEAMRRA